MPSALHTNIFEGITCRSDAYKILLSNQRRDANKLRWMTTIAGLFAGVSQISEVYQTVLLLLSFGMVVSIIIIFIDMSNRNSLLSIIDYHTWENSVGNRRLGKEMPHRPSH